MISKFNDYIKAGLAMCGIGAVLAAVVFACLLISPLLLLWALNTLLPITVAYSCKNLVAAFVVILCLRGGK